MYDGPDARTLGVMQTPRGMPTIFARASTGVLREQVSTAPFERARDAAWRPFGTLAAMGRRPGCGVDVCVGAGAASGNCAWSRGPSYQSWWFQRRLRCGAVVGRPRSRRGPLPPAVGATLVSPWFVGRSDEGETSLAPTG